MKNLFRIARWEFRTRVRSRSFLFNTFISPLLFTAVITLPIFFFNYEPEVSTKLVGVIDLSGKDIAKDLQKELNLSYRLQNSSREYVVLKVSVTNSEPYSEVFNDFQEVVQYRDSVRQVFEQIKVKRTEYYKNKRLPNRDYFLKTSYDQLQTSREEKELADIELKRYKIVLDSLYKFEAQKMADSLLYSNVLNTYLLFPVDFTKRGRLEYHSKNPGDLRETERFQKILQSIIIEKRILEDNVERPKVKRWLSPIEIRTYQLFPEGQTEWNFYAQFYGPLIGVFLLFMAIFTSGGYLFNSVLLEKSNRVIEVLLSYASSHQLMGGKIIGLGLLGLVQVLTWLAITALLVSSNLLPVHQVSYMTFMNAYLFLLYFSLGYLFYGAIFITVGSISANEYDAQQINQLLRTVAIFPVLLSLVVLAEPNSAWIQILSYIPFLTPSFMIMRIPLSSVPITADIYITSIIMAASIFVVILIAGRTFRVATLMQGKRATFSEIFRWLRVK